MCCCRRGACCAADAAAVIGAALESAAGGDGHRKIAGQLGRAAATVPGWLRRFAGRAEEVRVFFKVLLARTGPDPVMSAGAAGLVAAAVSAIAQPKSGPRKITRNLILDFAIFAWTGHSFLILIGRFVTLEL
jgi:hypothetical protein